MPILMDRYDGHPLSVPKYRSQCSVCHVYEDGSGALTAFGEKYDRTGLEFTPELVREYGNLFQGGASAGESGDAGSGGAAAAVPGNEPWNARRYYREECQKCHGRYGDGDPFQGVPAFATKQWLAERGSKPEELLQIILHGKDKMIGHAGKITEEEARELLEGVLTIARKYSE
jgi:mono/diheme cytochrome c family protein